MDISIFFFKQHKKTEPEVKLDLPPVHNFSQFLINFGHFIGSDWYSVPNWTSGSVFKTMTKSARKDKKRKRKSRIKEKEEEGKKKKKKQTARTRPAQKKKKKKKKKKRKARMLMQHPKK